MQRADDEVVRKQRRDDVEHQRRDDSLPPKRARNKPAIELQSAPPAAPAIKRIGIAMKPGASSRAPMSPRATLR